MENIRQKKKPWEEKKIFMPKKASENAFKKWGYHFNFKFKVQDTTKSVKQKLCVMICLNVPNFLYIYKKSLFE